MDDLGVPLLLETPISAYPIVDFQLASPSPEDRVGQRPASTKRTAASATRCSGRLLGMQIDP